MGRAVCYREFEEAKGYDGDQVLDLTTGFGTSRDPAEAVMSMQPVMKGRNHE